jgi:hypothetical protein
VPLASSQAELDGNAVFFEDANHSVFFRASLKLLVSVSLEFLDSRPVRGSSLFTSRVLTTVETRQPTPIANTAGLSAIHGLSAHTAVNEQNRDSSPAQ